MSETRRPMRISSDNVNGENKQWKVMTPDGRVRGPIGISGLRSLIEVGIAVPGSKIATHDDGDWVLLTEHEIWASCSHTAAAFAFRNADLVEADNSRIATPVDALVTTAREEAMVYARHLELERTYRRIQLHRLCSALRFVRELLVFLCFVTVGDLMLSLLGPEAGVAKWAAALGLVAIALGYYSFRSMENRV